MPCVNSDSSRSSDLALSVRLGCPGGCLRSYVLRMTLCFCPGAMKCTSLWRSHSLRKHLPARHGTLSQMDGARGLRDVVANVWSSSTGTSAREHRSLAKGLMGIAAKDLCVSRRNSVCATLNDRIKSARRRKLLSQTTSPLTRRCSGNPRKASWDPTTLRPTMSADVGMCSLYHSCLSLASKLWRELLCDTSG